MPHFARLLHLVDSALPTGSFAYSYGLESSLTFGVIQSQFGLRNYLYSYLQQVAGFELPFVHSCFQHPKPGPELYQLAQDYDAFQLVPALHRASLVQGRNWLKLLASFYPELNLTDLSAWFAKQEISLHFVPAFALGLQRAGFGRREVQTMLLHMALRDQLSAAIRLGFLGPMEGHRLQHDFYAVFDELLTQHAEKTHPQATRSAFLLDLAQSLHDDIYSKLFQN